MDTSGGQSAVSRDSIPFHGRSMYPTISNGDILDVVYFPKPVPITSLESGQVVLVRSGPEWVAHRLVEGPSGALQSKGDWAPESDQETMAWGLVVGINGQASPFTMSRLLGAISSIDLRWPQWIRIRKFVFIVSVKCIGLSTRGGQDV